MAVTMSTLTSSTSRSNSHSPPRPAGRRAFSESLLMLTRNRSLSVRTRKGTESSGTDAQKAAPKHRFAMVSLRGLQQPDLAKKLYKLIKSENHAISAHEHAGTERMAIATQLSEWGEATGDDAVSEISDKLGVLLSEIAEQENVFAENLGEYRGVLKQIRNTESSVQPSRDHKAKVSDEIQKLKYKEPANTKIVQLEQELVRAEAQSLVAEAQLTNITRQKFKEAYDIHLASIIERAEKQELLAKHARRLLNMLDDTPIVPGDKHQPFTHEDEARQVLNDAEEELKHWRSSAEPIHSSAAALGSAGVNNGVVAPNPHEDYLPPEAGGEVHPAYRSNQQNALSGPVVPGPGIAIGDSPAVAAVGPPYPLSEAERKDVKNMI